MQMAHSIWEHHTQQVGMEVTFVVISESDGTFFYNFVTTTITQDHVEVIRLYISN